jgi:hypothetical protein
VSVSSPALIRDFMSATESFTVKHRYAAINNLQIRTAMGDGLIGTCAAAQTRDAVANSGLLPVTLCFSGDIAHSCSARFTHIRESL